MKWLTYIALLIFSHGFLVTAQANSLTTVEEEQTLVWDEDDLDWLDEAYDDEDYTQFENNWSLNDTLGQQYKRRAFRNNWQQNYRNTLFDYTEKISKKSPSNNWDLSGFFQILAALAKIIGYALIALVVFLVLRALLTDSGISLQSFRRKDASYNVVKEGTLNIEEDWHSQAIEAKIRGDLKSAVRFYFLAYLKQLHQEKQIDFHKDKSNREYRYEINDTNTRNEFDVLSRVFDYCWYGDFEIGMAQFSRVELLFSKYLKR